MMNKDFWRSAGMHLVTLNDEGWLKVTPDYLRAYYARPEVHPIDTSCAAERRLFDELMEDPFCPVPWERLRDIADPDAIANYRAVLRLREHLMAAGTVEGAYLRIFQSGAVDVPPVFLDQMAHLILRNILKDCGDPMRLRAAELFFRDQTVSVDEGRVMLADEEIVELRAQRAWPSGPGPLILAALPETGTTVLDVLNEQNKEIYWERSEYFDTVIDFRFGLPALDAFARVIEAWLYHFLKLRVRVQPCAAIKDDDWRWHIGLDREATSILNALYKGEELGPETLERIIALLNMNIEDTEAVVEAARGSTIHLALAMNEKKRLKMKPQNLLLNLPLKAES